MGDGEPCDEEKAGDGVEGDPNEDGPKNGFQHGEDGVADPVGEPLDIVGCFRGFNGFEAFQSGVENGDGELCDFERIWGGGWEREG